MAKRRSKRRKHSANASVQVHGLTKAGTSIEVEIFADGVKTGRLVIGRGSVTWFGNKWHNGRRMSWSSFAQFMES